MEFKLFGCKFYISTLFVAFLCLVLFVDRTGIMLLGLISVAIHEAGHLVFMLIFRNLPRRISFQLGGIIIEKRPGLTGINNDIAVALGGCAFNVLAIVIGGMVYYFGHSKSEIILIFCVANLSLLMFNALPINGLDGGDIVRNLLYKKFLPHLVCRICNIISAAVLLLLSAVVIGLIFTQQPNYSLLVSLCYLVILALINIRR